MPFEPFVNRRNQRGWTMIELLLIAGILGIISAFVTTSILSIRHQKTAMEDVMRNVVGI